MLKIIADFAPYEPELHRIRSLGATVELIGPEERPRRVDPAILHDADVLFGMFAPENFEDMGKLRWIQLGSVGYAQLVPLGLPDRKIRASNARGCFDVPIAEWNIAMMVNLARNLRQMIRNQDQGIWDRSAVFQNEIRGRTVGIWGYGGIGRETARLARTLGMQVHVMVRGPIRPSGDIFRVEGTGDPEGVLPSRVFGPDQKEEFLSGLDFLILAVPLTKHTEGLIGETELSMLQRHAFVMNPARGPVIVEAALLRALREGWIAGAALDTHYHYPMPPDHPLWSFPNVIMTPHISGSSLSPRFGERAWGILCANVERFLSGKPLLNELTTAQLRGE